MRARVAVGIALVIGAAVIGGTQPLSGATARPAVGSLPIAWNVHVGSRGPVAEPVLFDGRAYTNDGARISAVDVAEGTLTWQTRHTYSNLGGVVLGPPSLVRGQIWTPWSWDRYAGMVESDPTTGAYGQTSGFDHTLG